MDFVVLEAEGLPDIPGGRQVYGLASGLAEKDVAKVMFHHHRQSGGGAPFLAPQLRALAAVSLVRCREDRLDRRDLSATAGGEGALLEGLARALARQQGPLLVWDGGRNVSAWLAVRTLVHRTTWGRPPVQRVETELDLAGPRIPRHDLAARLGIGSVPVPDDESSWEAYREQGEGRLAARCALNAAATARLWLDHCLARDAIAADDHGALAAQLLRVTPPPVTDAA